MPEIPSKSIFDVLLLLGVAAGTLWFFLKDRLDRRRTTPKHDRR